MSGSLHFILRDSVWKIGETDAVATKCENWSESKTELHEIQCFKNAAGVLRCEVCPSVHLVAARRMFSSLSSPQVWRSSHVFTCLCPCLSEEYDRYPVQRTPQVDMYSTWKRSGTNMKLMLAAGTQNFQPSHRRG
jgi:hypothetical protein